MCGGEPRLKGAPCFLLCGSMVEGLRLMELPAGDKLIVTAWATMNRRFVGIFFRKFEYKLGGIWSTVFANANRKAVCVDSGQAFGPKTDNNSRGV